MVILFLQLGQLSPILSQYFLHPADLYDENVDKESSQVYYNQGCNRIVDYSV